MENLLSALVAAKSEFLPIKKERSNPYFNSRYADLDTILSATTPALCINGLSIVQTTKIVGDSMVLVTTLYHKSGESISSEYWLCNLSQSEETELDKYGKPKKTNLHQKIGSALTYARRYSYCAILSVTADDDDDGASSPQTRSKTDTETEKLMEQTYKQIMALGWTGKDASHFLQSEFGVRTRAELDLVQLREFSKKLSNLQNPSHVPNKEVLQKEINGLFSQLTYDDIQAKNFTKEHLGVSTLAGISPLQLIELKGKLVEMVESVSEEGKTNND